MIVTDAPEPIDPRSCATKPRRRAQLIEQSSNSLKSIYRDPLRERLPDKDLFICERIFSPFVSETRVFGFVHFEITVFVAVSNICSRRTQFVRTCKYLLYIKIIVGFDNTTFARTDFCIDKKDNDRKYRIYKVWFVRKIDSDWETKQTRNIRRSSWAQMNGMKHINRRVFIT